MTYIYDQLVAEHGDPTNTPLWSWVDPWLLPPLNVLDSDRPGPGPADLPLLLPDTAALATVTIPVGGGGRP